MDDIEMKVIDHPHLVRRRGAIVNKDREGYNRFMAARELAVKRDERINDLESRVEFLTEALEKLMGVKDAPK